jgi:hypothetical protein
LVDVAAAVGRRDLVPDAPLQRLGKLVEDVALLVLHSADLSADIVTP